jgi:hypothetical protein
MYSIIQRSADICTDTSYQDIELDAKEGNNLISWDNIVAYDEDSDLDTIGLYLRHGNSVYWLGIREITIARESAGIRGPIWAPGNYIVGARFYGASSGDKLILSAFGHQVA